MGWFFISRMDGKGILGEANKVMRYLKERKEVLQKPNGDWTFLLEAVINEARRRRAVSDGPSTNAVLDP